MTQHILQIIPRDLLSIYREHVSKDLSAAFKALQEAEISTSNFNFYISVSSVYSSKIEGEDIELDSYIKHKKFGIEFYLIIPKKSTTSTMPIPLPKRIRSMQKTLSKPRDY